jgi:hypothetical protein
LSSARHKEMALKQIGSKKKVLVLKSGQGLSRDYWPVQFTNSQPNENAGLAQTLVNQEVTVQIAAVAPSTTAHHDVSLRAELN